MKALVLKVESKGEEGDQSEQGKGNTGNLGLEWIMVSWRDEAVGICLDENILKVMF